MGQPQPLPSPEKHDSGAPVVVKPAVTSLEDVRCALCGVSLVGRAERHRMVSPLITMGAVTVCHVCRRAAVGEGYRPVH